MVLVTVGGGIHQRLITLTEPVQQERLSETAARMTQLLQGKTAEEVKKARNRLQGLDQDVVNWIVEDMNQADSLTSGEVYLDGLTNVLAEPEFSTSSEARRALRLLEERSLLYDLLSRTILNSNIGGIQVLIGGEGAWDELRQCSMVLARYGAPGLVTGTLGVLGPIRMSYGRAISTVRFIARLLSDMVAESLGD
jgi:heat-inducible transcriptional repressor